MNFLIEFSFPKSEPTISTEHNMGKKKITKRYGFVFNDPSINLPFDKII